MRMAIVGSGIAGMTAAHLLHKEHDITLYEADDHVGGHAHTVEATVRDQAFAVDTGFMVFNKNTYPGLTLLLDKLGVECVPTTMSFSLSCERTGLEYCPSSLNSIFAQRRNLFRPSFYRIFTDIFRFKRESRDFIDHGDYETTLMEYLKGNGYSRSFIDHFIIPMGAAIWSADADSFGDISARLFMRFLSNHGMLKIHDQPQWLTISGGSREYVKRLTAPFRDRIRLSTPVVSIRRFDDRVEVVDAAEGAAEYDHVIIAVHSDQVPRILKDIKENEREILEAIPYSRNRTTLHTDERLLPKLKRAWASWNYRVPRQSDNHVLLTYNMNRLQSLASPETLCVTLNGFDRIDPKSIRFDVEYSHPLFSAGSVAAQARWKEINGRNRTSFCGAYWRYGFHEDGLQSALWVCKPFGKELT